MHLKTSDLFIMANKNVSIIIYQSKNRNIARNIEKTPKIIFTIVKLTSNLESIYVEFVF